MTQTPSASPSRRRAPRIPRDEARRRLLAAALSQVRQHGLRVGFEEMFLTHVASDAAVSRSAIYRAWDSKSAFVEDLLVEVAQFGSQNLNDDEAIAMAVDLVEAHPHLFESADGRRRLLLETIRTVLEHNYYFTVDSIPWQTFLSLSATLLGPMSNGLRQRLENAVEKGSAEFIAEMSLRYERLCSLLGFRISGQFEGGYPLFATLASSIVEGLAIRHLSVPSMTDNWYLGDATVSGGREDWGPAAIGFLAVFDKFMESDPDFDPGSTSDWLRQMRLRNDGRSSKTS